MSMPTPESDATRGLSQRELILEIRNKLDRLEDKIDSKVGRGELLAWLGGTATVVALALRAMGV